MSSPEEATPDDPNSSFWLEEEDDESLAAVEKMSNEANTSLVNI